MKNSRKLIAIIVGLCIILGSIPVANACYEPLGKITISKVLKPGATCSEDFSFKITGPNSYTVTKQFKAGQSVDLNDLKLGTYTIEEINIPDGYVFEGFDSGSPVSGKNAVTVCISEAHPTLCIKATNSEKGRIRIVKKDVQSGNVLAGVEFMLSIDGTFTDMPKVYTTDANGVITTGRLSSGAYHVRETKTLPGYTIDKTDKDVVVELNKTTEVNFTNTPHGDIHIVKTDAETKNPLKGVTFKISADGTFNDIATVFETDDEGFIDIKNLVAGSYSVKEIETLSGYILDTTVQIVTVKLNETAEVSFKNVPSGTIRILKTDAQSGLGMAGVKFQLSRDGTFTDMPKIYITEADGSIIIANLPYGTYKVKEVETLPGYILDTTIQDATVELNKTATVTFTNVPTGDIRIKKTDALTGSVLADVQFKISKDGTFNDMPKIYTTNASGIITTEKLPYGTYKVREIKTLPGYILDTNDQDAVVELNKTTEVSFKNVPAGGIRIIKKDAVTGKTMAGVTFQLSKDGTFNDMAKLYITDKDGLIFTGQLPYGTYQVREIATLDGYILDTKDQTAKIETSGTVNVTFTNVPTGNIQIVKKDAQSGNAMANVQIMISKDGTFTDMTTVYYTDANGLIDIKKLPCGTYKVKEIATLPGYILDTTVKDAKVELNQTAIVTFANVPTGNIHIVKTDALTGKALAGIKFKLSKDGTFNDMAAVYTTDAKGFIDIWNLPYGTYKVKEIETLPGYILDTTVKDAIVELNKTAEVSFANIPGSTIRILKTDAQTEEPLAGVKFKISKDGTFNDMPAVYTTDANGEIIIANLLYGTYKVKEIETLPGYLLDTTVQEMKVEMNQIVLFTFTNVPVGTVRIVKKDAQTDKPLAGVKIQLSKDGTFNDMAAIYTTDADGLISINNLPCGNYKVRENQTLPGYILDTNVKDAKVELNKTTDVVFTNMPSGSIRILKTDAVTGETLAGVEFKLSKDGTFNDMPAVYTTNAVGVITVNNLPCGTYYVRETYTLPGYALDKVDQTVTIELNKTAEVSFVNVPYGHIMIIKTDAQSKLPMAGVQFKLSKDGTFNDMLQTYTTDDKGIITTEELALGMYMVREVATLPGYILDMEDHPAEVVFNQATIVTFTNVPFAMIKIIKLDSVTKVRLPGAVFKITAVDPKTGLETSVSYTVTTDSAAGTLGTVLSPQILPGIYNVVEVTAPVGYVKDPLPQQVTLQINETKELTFTNKPYGDLILDKQDAQTHKQLEGAEFEIYQDEAGTQLYARKTTGTDGRITLDGMVPGVYYVKESKAPLGYKISNEVFVITILPGKDNHYTLYNAFGDVDDYKSGTLKIVKLDKDTQKPLTGATFNIYADASLTVLVDTVAIGNLNGEEVALDVGTYYVKEVIAPKGYKADAAVQTVVIKEEETTVATFHDTKETGGIKLTKVDGYLFGPLAGAKFDVYSDAALKNRVVKDAVTGTNGEIIMENLVPGQYYLVETQAPKDYKLDESPRVVAVVAGKLTPIQIANQLDDEKDYNTGTMNQNLIAGGLFVLILGMVFLLMDVIRMISKGKRKR